MHTLVWVAREQCWRVVFSLPGKDDRVIGDCDTAELAANVVNCLNGGPAMTVVIDKKGKIVAANGVVLPDGNPT